TRCPPRCSRRSASGTAHSAHAFGRVRSSAGLPRYVPRPDMAKSPDPTIALTTLAGRTRTVDDGATMFHLVLVVLPDRPEASRWVPVAQRIFATFGDADCRTAFVVPSTPSIARKILDGAEATEMMFVDPDRELVTSLG